MFKAQACAALAQLVEHRIRNAGVVGSNPISGTIKPVLTGLYRLQIFAAWLYVQPLAR